LAAVTGPAPAGGAGGSGGASGRGEAAAGSGAVRPRPDKSPAAEDAGGRLLLGIAAAPSWNGFYADGNIIRGAAAQIRLGAETSSLGRPMIFGLELRPEWDAGLGVFHMPITLSWGLDDRFRLFIGPAFSVGDAVLKTSGGDRPYTGGTSWIGSAGITVAPFAMKVPGGNLAVYGEFAWQSYFSDAGAERNWNADFAAGCRFSTGLRCTWRL
jgi:hypothetical protein